MKKLLNKHLPHIDGPLLDKVTIALSESVDTTQYPFSLDIMRSLKFIDFPTQVTFFVGENGAGKSTILEAIASKVGFGAEGGSKNINVLKYTCVRRH